MEDKYVRELVVARLKTMPPNVSFFIGGHGDFTRDQLIREVVQGTEIGKETIKSELRLVQEMPKLVSRLQTQ